MLEKGMPMIGCGDENAVNVGALHDFLVVNIGFRAGRFGRCHTEPLLVDITQRNYLNVRFVSPMLEYQIQKICAACTKTDKCNIDTIIRAQHTTLSRGGGKHHTPNGRSLYEVPTGHLPRRIHS